MPKPLLIFGGNVLDLITTVQLAGSAVRFVEGGPLAEALAELNMRAAQSALNNAQAAKDKRAQVWSAVNHLEGALVALDSKLVGARGKVQVALRYGNWNILAYKRKYVLALLAICYRYLEEEKLAQQALESVRGEYDPYKLHGNRAPYIGYGMMPNLLDDYRYRRAKDNWVDWAEFELPPRALPTSGGISP
jgi:hypothetical protein